MTKELVVITQATREIMQIIEAFKSSAMRLHDRYKSDFAALYQATLIKMEAVIATEPELLIVEDASWIGEE